MNKKNLKIIPLKKSVFYKIEELVYPSNSSFMPINVKDFSSYASDYIVSSSALNFVRTRVLGHYGIETKQAVGTKKIIISRKNLKHARLKNERRVLELMSNRGFEIIFPECMSLQEQVRVFSQAGVVAGTTGAAFTNLIYCPKNALIMNIIPKRYNFFL
ncbi:MAG TPA: glycosyltransferase family 61 protein, partial [Spirochaetota bacterium]|nr:glycosyltransferase family 61 protein [Spirochaetota bacterium]